MSLLFLLSLISFAFSFSVLCRKGRSQSIMVSTSLPSFIQISSTNSSFTEKLSTPQKKFQIRISTNSLPFPSLPSCKPLQNSVPLAASLAILLWTTPGRYHYHVLLLSCTMLCHYVVLCRLKFHSLIYYFIDKCLLEVYFISQVF